MSLPPNPSKQSPSRISDLFSDVVDTDARPQMVKEAERLLAAQKWVKYQLPDRSYKLVISVANKSKDEVDTIAEALKRIGLRKDALNTGWIIAANEQVPSVAQGATTVELRSDFLYTKTDSASERGTSPRIPTRSDGPMGAAQAFADEVAMAKAEAARKQIEAERELLWKLIQELPERKSIPSANNKGTRER